MMYQLPSDMMNRIVSVVLATGSPCSHSAFRPYGFATFVVSAPLPGVGRFAGGASAGGGAGVAGVAAGAGAGGGVVCALTSEIPAHRRITEAQAAPLNVLSNMATVPLHWILEERR